MMDEAVVAEVLDDLRQTLLGDDYGSLPEVLRDFGAALMRSTRAVRCEGVTVLTLDVDGGKLFDIAAHAVATLVLSVAERRKEPAS